MLRPAAHAREKPMIRKIPCSAKTIPCFRREQGIRRNAMDLQLELMPSEAKTGPRSPIFQKFPVIFPVFRESAALPQAPRAGRNRSAAPPRQHKITAPRYPDFRARGLNASGTVTRIAVAI
jgi:hypothetical protein